MEIRKRGFDVDKLLYYHRQNKHFENKVIHTLNDMGIEVQIANKYAICKYACFKLVNMCDCVICHIEPIIQKQKWIGQTL